MKDKKSSIALTEKDSKTKTFEQACKECHAIPHSQFVHNWMAQLEQQYKNKK